MLILVTHLGIPPQRGRWEKSHRAIKAIMGIWCSASAIASCFKIYYLKGNVMRYLNTIFRNIILFILFSCIALSTQANEISANTNNNNILLFVSLGMPKDVLRQYLIQAKIYHIPVLIRGLYTDKNDLTADKTVGSFKDTANRVLQILKSEKGFKKSMGGVSINPLLFRSFHITVVPALVVTNHANTCITKNHEHNENIQCPENDFDVIYGNIPIRKQLKIISQKTNSFHRAFLIRQRLSQYS